MPTTTNINEVLHAIEDAAVTSVGANVRELVQVTKLSETTVRMTVNRLIADGFVERVPQATTRFRPISKHETGEEVNKMATTKTTKKAAAKKAPAHKKAATASKAVAPRGNGKSAETRDAEVLAFVKSRKNGVTLQDVREKFGLSYNLAYLSLSRGREAGAIVVEATGTRTPMWVAA